MFKSAASAAALAGMLVVVTSVGAIALRLYRLSYLAAKRIRCGGSPMIHVSEAKEQR